MGITKHERVRCKRHLDQSPERLCFKGSGFPRPEEGSSERSISFRSLHRALCSLLSFSRICSYASQVLPSNTSDLIHLLFGRFIALAMLVSFKRGCNLLHQVTVLQNRQRFLFTLPVFGAQNDKGLACSAGNLQGLMSANYLFYKTFQVIAKLVYAYGIHMLTIVYGNSVQLYASNGHRGTLSKAKSKSDRQFPA